MRVGRLVLGTAVGVAMLIALAYGAGALTGIFWLGVCSMARC